MPTTTHTCPKCHNSMEVGFIVDHSHAYRLVSRWMPGPAKLAFWGGLKIVRAELMSTRTFRCIACGFLESYAKPEFDV